MDDEADQALASQSPEDIQVEDNRDVQQQSKFSKGEDEDRVTVTVDTVVDAFFALGGNQGDGSGSKCSDDLSQDHNDPMEVTGYNSDDDEEGQLQAPVLDGEEDKIVQYTDGGDGSVMGLSNAYLQEHDMEQVGKGDGDGGKDFEGGGKQTFDETSQSPRDVEQEKESRQHVQGRQQRSSGNDHAASGIGEGMEVAYAVSVTQDIESCRGNEDGDRKEDGEVNKSDDNEENEHNETGALHSEGWNFSMTSEDDAESRKQPDELENADVTSDDFNSHDASLVAQGLVDDVLDKVFRAEVETGENNAGRMGLELVVKAHYPELEKVDLNSDDWDNDFHARGSTSQDNVSLSSSVHDDDSQQHELDKLSYDSEQTPNPAVDVNGTDTVGGIDTKVSDLHGEFQSLHQHLVEHSHPADVSHQSQGKATATHTVAGEGERCFEENNKKQSLENGDRHESACVTSPKPEYPLNYNNYKVCRMLSPGVKECLILETGEQVRYDCNKRCLTQDAAQVKSPPASCRPTQTDRESVKRDLFPDTERVQRSAETASFPPTTLSTDRVTILPTEKIPTSSHSPPQQHHSVQLGSRKVSERSAEVEDSQDGSYLWLQRQLQWRAGSHLLPANTAVRDIIRVSSGETSPSSGLYQERRSEIRGGDGDEARENVVGAGMSVSMSQSAETSGSVASPGAIPNFRTLQDQQVSWLSMYRMLEDQHRGELRAQHAEHQRRINDMQHYLEGELLSQQQNMRQKLDFHREALTEWASCASYRNAPERSSSYGSQNVQSDDSNTDVLQQNSHYSSLVEPSERARRQFADRLTLHQSGSARSAQKESSERSPQANQSSSSRMVHEKRLCGGVYSSPMPIGKVRTSAREHSGRVADSKQLGIHSTNKNRWSEESQPLHSAATADSSLQHGQALSPRTRLSLREKHAKHLSDLRVYYEAEIQDLRRKLSALSGGPVLSSLSTAADRETARERILQEENQTLRREIRDLQDSLDDAHIHSRDLEQKLQGLEIRAANYAERYEESQHNVMKLKNRLEELHSYAKDKESVLEQVQSNERRQAVALQELCKAQEEQTETARKDKSALNRLLDKYEMLEKDYNALKETSAEFEKKLFDTRAETVELSKMISQLELENKILTQENENLRKRLSMSSRSPVRREVTPPRRVMSDEEDADMDKNSDSPLLRAEQELRRLQKSMDCGNFAPRLQQKKYSADYHQSVNRDVTILDALTSPTRNATNSLAVKGSQEGPKKAKKTVNSVATSERTSGRQCRQAVESRPGLNSSCDNLQSSSLSSPTRFDVGVQQMGSRSAASPGGVKKERGSSREVAGRRTGDPSPVSTSSASKSGSTASQLVDATLDHISRGDIVSRPQWEDVYTSLAKPQQPDNKASALNMTQEEMLRDRIRSIDQMERRYDALQAEKRKLESQLNKVPSHGRDRKTRREKDLLEEKLDKVDHELGSLRMTLKRYQVLKTTM